MEAEHRKIIILKTLKNMALINCSECGHPISDKAIKCPECGAPIQAGGATEATNPNSAIPQNEVPSGNNGNHSLKPQRQSSNMLPWIIVSILSTLLLVIGGYFLYTFLSDKEVETSEVTETEVVEEKEDEFNVEDFIAEYYEAAEMCDFDKCASFYEDDDVSYFNKEHMSKEEILKRMKKHNRITKSDIDWETLQTTQMPSGDIKAVFLLDHYIYSDTKKDYYRLKAEFIISANKKIKSIHTYNI